MDHDLFKYIVIILFILGALRSLFKKRPPQEPVKNPQSPEQWSTGREAAPVYKPPVAVNTDVDDYAIQREIEKMFGRVTPVSKPEPPIQEVQYSSPGTTAYSVAIPEGYQEETKKETVSEMTLILEKKIRGDESARRFRESIKVKLQSPQSLKDYIVISEILGKPKAFE